MLKLTQEQKLHFASMLRNPGVLIKNLPEHHFDIINEVDTSEMTVASKDGYPVKVYRSDAKDRKPGSMLYINIHGGGFVQPHQKKDDALAAYIAKELHCTVLDVDYRLAPEYPFPKGLEDAYAVYRWAFQRAEEIGCDPKKIIVGGNSSGGQFSASICMIAAKQGDPIPALCVMLYPVCALDDVESVTEDANLEDLSNRGKLYNLLYCTKKEDFDNPYVSLLDADEEDLKRFPNTIMITGGQDILAPGGEEFAKRVAAASGSRVVMRRFLESPHGFILSCLGPEWQSAREFLVSEVKHLVS